LKVLKSALNFFQFFNTLKVLENLYESHWNLNWYVVYLKESCMFINNDTVHEWNFITYLLSLVNKPHNLKFFVTLKMLCCYVIKSVPVGHIACCQWAITPVVVLENHCKSPQKVLESCHKFLPECHFSVPRKWQQYFLWWLQSQIIFTFSSSHMHAMNHNWSATKQRLHPQNVAEISCHSVLSGNRIRQCGTSSGSRHKDRSVSVSRHFLLQAPQCPCSVRKRFSRDHCCRGRSKPGCRIVGSHTRWELTTWADFQLCLHRLLMSTSCKYSHNGFLDVSPNVHQQNSTERKNIPWNISCGCILHSSVSETCSWSMALSLSPTTDSWPSSRAPPPYQTLHAVHNSKYFNTWSPVTTILVRCPLQGAATW